MIKYPVMILYMSYVCLLCFVQMFQWQSVCTNNLLQQDLFLLTIIILKALCNRQKQKHIYIEIIL